MENILLIYLYIDILGKQDIVIDVCQTYFQRKSNILQWYGHSGIAATVNAEVARKSVICWLQVLFEIFSLK